MHPLITIQQAAELLQCKPVTIRRMISRGCLKAYRFPGSRLIRVDPRDLDRIKRPVTNVADLVGAGDAA
ncbi:helix-turn-helix domain-containing protein [Actinomyces provencensis]|uniref:helix-turn-helix domain-containing protein n=1 Tax=Actinomyces provencensis TaxID=1720198 RepID=UPI00096A5CE6|nr:helix-turn-helix domain-containing protein [Actinomyces provencensis]